MLDLEGGVGEQQEEGIMTISRILTNLFNSVLGEQYKCDVCDLVLKNKYNLREHVSVLHTPRQPPLKCSKDFCQETFVTKYEWEQHRVGCSFTCTNCGKVIRKCGRMEGHLRSKPFYQSRDSSLVPLRLLTVHFLQKM